MCVRAPHAMRPAWGTQVPIDLSASWRAAEGQGLPEVFTGGWVGYTGYDTVRYVYSGGWARGKLGRAMRACVDCVCVGGGGVEGGQMAGVPCDSELFAMAVTCPPSPQSLFTPATAHPSPLPPSHTHFPSIRTPTHTHNPPPKKLRKSKENKIIK
jgi:hypothetical protein